MRRTTIPEQTDHATAPLDAVIVDGVASLPSQLHQAREEIAQLRRALDSSRTIGIATGIVAERLELTPDAAFAWLVEASQHSNRKLRDIAADVVLSTTAPRPRCHRRATP